jgi:type VI secretion system protein ImpA
MSSPAPEAGTVGPTSSVPVSPPPVVEVTALLQPIPGDNPAGENTQYSGLHDEIRESRRSDDDLPQGDWEREPKLAEWPKVAELSTSALMSKTKDLQICAWMTEGIVHLHGFVGLRDGLKVMRGLHEYFWENLYPEKDGEDLEGRVNALSWFDSKLALPLKKVPLTKSGSGVEYNYLQWEESTKFDFPEDLESLQADAYTRAVELKAQAEAEGRTSSDAWRRVKGATRRAFYEEQFLVLNECWDEFQALGRAIDEKFGRQALGLGTLRKSLEEVRSLIEKVVKEKRILEPDPVSSDGSSATEGGGAGGAKAVGPVSSRDDALRRLAEVALYFQRTEPHSPVAYLVQRAIKWGQMPLEVWLEDVIRDGTVLGQIRETLGIGTDMPVTSGGGSDSGQA